MSIETITAVTSVLPEGQKCTGVMLRYDLPVSGEAVDAAAYIVEGRTIIGAAVCQDEEGTAAEKGSWVFLSLSPDDESAATFCCGHPWEGIGAKITAPRLRVQQIRDIRSGDVLLPAWPQARENDGVRNELVDEFVQGTFEGLAYNLFIPRDYDENRSYPLVQFIHDASVCGEDPECTLAQGVGALVWMTKKAQARNECFVLAPQFAPPTIVEDDWSVDPRLETEKRLLDHIVSSYSIDRKRLYTTGQSMGCMSSMVLNLRYPDLFAASFFVAGQWDERQFEGSGLEKKNFWFINSQGDAKAFPGMNQILCVLEKEGAQVAREIWNAGEEQRVYEEKAAALIATGANMIYTPFEITTVADGWHSHGGDHHVHTWRHAYGIETIQNWLFAQHLD